MPTEIAKLDELHLDPANVRLHPERNMRTIRASLARFGPARSIVIDGNGVVRAGNGTVEGAIAEGFKDVLIVDPEPGQLIAVRRKDWNQTEGTAYSLADNESALQSEWNEEGRLSMLAALHDEGFDMTAVGYTADELAELLDAGLAEETAEPENKGTGLSKLSEVTIDEPKAVVNQGDVVELGRHILLCVDVLKGWPAWVPHLKEGSIFCPYPSPFLPLAMSDHRFVLVQPDPYLCAVMVDFWNATQK